MTRRRWTTAVLAMALVIVGGVVGAYAMQGGTRAAGPPASSYLSVNGMMASADGPIKTFPLRGIKDTRSSPSCASSDRSS